MTGYRVWYQTADGLQMHSCSTRDEAHRFAANISASVIVALDQGKLEIVRLPAADLSKTAA
jgi:hypothetical protein